MLIYLLDIDFNFLIFLLRYYLYLEIKRWKGIGFSYCRLVFLKFRCCIIFKVELFVEIYFIKFSKNNKKFFYIIVI